MVVCRKKYRAVKHCQSIIIVLDNGVSPFVTRREMGRLYETGREVTLYQPISHEAQHPWSKMWNFPSSNTEKRISVTWFNAGWILSIRIWSPSQSNTHLNQSNHSINYVCNLKKYVQKFHETLVLRAEARILHQETAIFFQIRTGRALW